MAVASDDCTDKYDLLRVRDEYSHDRITGTLSRCFSMTLEGIVALCATSTSSNLEISILFIQKRKPSIIA